MCSLGNNNNYYGLECPRSIQAAPIRTVEQVVCHRNERVPVQRQVRTQVPVQRQVRTQVPVQRAVHGTKQIVHNVTVNRQRVENYTVMVPSQRQRVVNVPTIERRVQNVPTVNYVTDMQERVHTVTDMQERVHTVTDFVNRRVPVVQRRVRTRYETVQDLPPQDLALSASIASGSASHLALEDGGLLGHDDHVLSYGQQECSLGC